MTQLMVNARASRTHLRVLVGVEDPKSPGTYRFGFDAQVDVTYGISDSTRLSIEVGQGAAGGVEPGLARMRADAFVKACEIGQQVAAIAGTLGERDWYEAEDGLLFLARLLAELGIVEGVS